ncbi:hypothetical protein Tco_1517663 [Tanacetum coccineum]
MLHIKAVMNIGGPFLGVLKAVARLFSVEAKDIATDSGLDWSPEEGYALSKRKGKNDTCPQNESGGKLRVGKCTNRAKMIEEEALAYQRSFFSHGQLYDVVSRVKSMKGLKIMCCDKDGKYTNSTINVVDKEALFRI